MNLGRMLMVVGIAYGIMYPQTLSGLTERLYEQTVDQSLRPLVHQMNTLNDQVARIEGGFERHVYSRGETRRRLLALYERFDQLLYTVSTTDSRQYDRDEVADKIRDAQHEINNWGSAHGF